METPGTGKLAIVFPGLGAHEASMLDGLTTKEQFQKYYPIVSEALGFCPLEALERDPLLVNDHVLSNVLTVFASALSFCEFSEVKKEKPDFYAGYSIGEYTALYAAGCFDFAELISLIKMRATIIEESTIPGAMLGVIGIGLPAIEAVVNELMQQGQRIYVSNYNCAGQYSLSGTKDSIAEALERLTALKPKRLLQLPVSGPRHCPLLEEAQHAIAKHFRQSKWKRPRVPVIDNVTGELLPDDVDAIKEQVIKEITSPVRWDTCIRTLIKLGCNRFIEVGYGNVLTKFGFFIDRNADFSTYYGDSRIENPVI